MPKTKISEFSATANSNTDINSINIAEGCAPSNINDAIRELMAELKDFQAGTKGDSFNGPVGTTTAAAGAFTTLSASSTVSGTGFSTYLASPPAIGGTAPAAGAFTTLSSTGNTTLGDASGDTVTINGTATFANVNPTLSAGTANGVLYLNGSKVATSGSALTFDGANLRLNGGTLAASGYTVQTITAGAGGSILQLGDGTVDLRAQINAGGGVGYFGTYTNSSPLSFQIGGSEQMRLTSTGLGIGTSSPQSLLNTASTGQVQIGTSSWPTNFIGKSNARTIIGNEGVLILWNEAAATAGNEAALYIGPKGSGTNGSTIIAGGYVKGISESSSTNNGALTFGTNGGGGNSEKMRLDSSGNLGLGVTPSAWSLGKALQIGTSGAASLLGYNNSFYLTANAYYDGSWKYTATAAAGRYQLESGVHSWSIAPSGTAGNTITFTQAMTLDASGRLSVATTNPTNGGFNPTIAAKSLTDSIGGGIMVEGSGADATLNMGYDGTSMFISSSYRSTAGYKPIAFYTSGAERARITSGGSFVIGANATSAANEFLRVYGSNANWIGSFENTNTNPYGNLIQYSSTKNGTGNEFLGCYEGGGASTRLSIRSNGGIANYQANDVNLSDRREKTNFAPAGEYLSKICAIPVQTFNYIDQNLEEDAGLTLGVVAQDVQAVAPELVMESNWAKEGEEPKMRLSIYQTDLQYALMKSIQELKAELDSVKAELAQLKGA